MSVGIKTTPSNLAYLGGVWRANEAHCIRFASFVATCCMCSLRLKVGLSFEQQTSYIVLLTDTTPHAALQVIPFPSRKQHAAHAVLRVLRETSALVRLDFTPQTSTAGSGAVTTQPRCRI